MCDCAPPLMGRMWPVAIKNDVDMSCGFIGAPGSARSVGEEMAIRRGARAEWFHGIAKPQRDSEGHVSRNLVLGICVFWVFGRKVGDQRQPNCSLIAKRYHRVESRG